jgi:hypothetical protein
MNATTYPDALAPRRLRLSLNRRPTVADRIRAAMARAALRLAARLAPSASPMRSTTLWNG